MGGSNRLEPNACVRVCEGAAGGGGGRQPFTKSHLGLRAVRLHVDTRREDAGDGHTCQPCTNGEEGLGEGGLKRTRRRSRPRWGGRGVSPGCVGVWVCVGWGGGGGNFERHARVRHRAGAVEGCNPRTECLPLAVHTRLAAG